MSGHSLGWFRRADGRAWVVFPLRTWLTFSHLTVFALPIAVLLGSGALALDLRNQTVWDLQHQGAVLSVLVAEQLRSTQERRPDATLEGVGPALSKNLQAIKASTLSGIQVTDADGIVIATSGQVLGEDLSGEPEVEWALDGKQGVATKPRGPTGSPISSRSRRARVRMFVAVPITVDDRILGAIVLSRTPREELQALYHMSSTRALALTALALCFALWIGLFAGYLLTRSLGEVASGAVRIADGNFDAASEIEPAEQSHVADVARLASAVRTMSVRLEGRLSYISEFASNVSHEFKTPLATLRGTLELIEDDPDMPLAQRETFLVNAQAELSRLERMVSGLLLLARADEGGTRAPVALQDLIARVSSRYDLTATGLAGTVVGDAVQLESVLSNLIENALTHGGDTVSIRGWTDADRTGWTVVDNGSGISRANLPRVFDRFFTTRRAEGGSGLGLSLVRAVVDAHGGQVSVTSEDGSTTFRVALPVRHGAGAEAPDGA